MSNAFKAGRVIAPDAKWTGDEPEWNGWETWPTEKFYKTRSRALSFYNYYLDAASLRPMVLDWMKKNGYSKVEIQSIKNAPPYILPSTVGKLIRCMERGMPSIHPDAHEYFSTLPFHETPPIPKDDAETVHHEIAKALSTLKIAIGDNDGVDAKPKVASMSPLDRIKERVNKEVISQLEELLDTWASTASGSQSLNLSSFLRDSKIPAQGCKTILDWLERYLAEFGDALNKEDAQLVEGYAYMAKPDLRKIVKSLEEMISDVKSHAKIKVASRKPRKKKVKDASKQVSRLKYQTHSADYSIDSISPSRIPTSQRLYVFNTKTRALGVYYANGAAGFEVKGTSLKGFDASRSFLCTLRKPKETLNTILSSTPKQLDKYCDGLTTKKKAANGRINEQTIILKVIEHKI
jgi:hypothetical protein